MSAYNTPPTFVPVTVMELGDVAVTIEREEDLGFFPLLIAAVAAVAGAAGTTAATIGAAVAAVGAAVAAGKAAVDAVDKALPKGTPIGERALATALAKGVDGGAFDAKLRTPEGLRALQQEVAAKLSGNTAKLLSQVFEGRAKSLQKRAAPPAAPPKPKTRAPAPPARPTAPVMRAGAPAPPARPTVMRAGAPAPAQPMALMQHRQDAAPTTTKSNAVPIALGAVAALAAAGGGTWWWMKHRKETGRASHR